MSKPKTPKPLLLFYLIVVYVALQFSWWAYLLITTNNRAAELQSELLNYQTVTDAGSLNAESLVAAKEKLDADLHKRWLMILGEGAVFIVLLSWAIARTRSGFKREALLAERQKNFLLSVTHELRSPLASIGLQAETLLKRDLPKEKQSQILSHVLEDTERLNALIGNILLAARIDNHSFTIQKSAHNFSEFTEQLVQKIAAGVGHQHAFVLRFEKNVTVPFDNFAAHSIVANLVENAIKYSPAGTSITVSLAKRERQFIFSVTDEGKGIADSEKKTVFERFYRSGSEETRSTKGTGLGLYIASYLAEMHGWTISVSDNQPKGSTFTVEIPITHEQQKSSVNNS